MPGSAPGNRGARQRPASRSRSGPGWPRRGGGSPEPVRPAEGHGVRLLVLVERAPPALTGEFAVRLDPVGQTVVVDVALVVAERAVAVVVHVCLARRDRLRAAGVLGPVAVVQREL